MIYSYKEVSTKLDELLAYSKNAHSSIYHSQMETQVSKVKAAISNYLGLKKNDLAKKFEEFIQSYLWYSSNKSQECENDAYLGIVIPTLPQFYFVNDFRLLLTNGCFNFATIMNTSNETFNSAWIITTNSSSGTGMTTSIVVNSLIGYDDSAGHHSGWVDSIAAKREIEIANVKKAIADMEDNFWEVPDVIETFEDRGSPKSDLNITIDTTPKKYKVIVRTVEGDRIEERYGSSSEYKMDPLSTIEGTAKLLYMPEYKGMFDIIRCLEMYNINDFASNSKPCSTYGSNKIYIPSYLKGEFKKLIS